MKRSILLACAALGLVMVGGCKKSEPMAANVNGEAISLDQYHQFLEVKPQVQVLVVPGQLTASTNGQLPQQPYKGQVIGSLGLQALNDLIQQTIVKQLAKDENVYPTDAEIKEALDERSKQNPTFVRDLIESGFKKEMIENEITVQLAQYKLTTQGITVSEDEVTRYITEHPKEFIVPESAEMIWMLVSDDKKAAADADLKTGQSFITIAAKYSVAPNTKAAGYKFPESSIPRLANYGPDLMGVVQKTGEEAQTPWIKFTEGWAKFYVSKKSKERKVNIDDAMRKNVRKALALQKGSQGKDVNQRILERLKSAKIVIGIPHLVEPWKRSLESLQTTSPTTSTPPPNP